MMNTPEQYTWVCDSLLQLQTAYAELHADRDRLQAEVEHDKETINRLCVRGVAWKDACDRLQAEVEQLRTANEHWHIRIETLKTENELLKSQCSLPDPPEIERLRAEVDQSHKILADAGIKPIVANEEDPADALVLPLPLRTLRLAQEVERLKELVVKSQIDGYIVLAERDQLQRLRDFDTNTTPLPAGLMLEHARLDKMWQQLIKERDTARQQLIPETGSAK